MKRYRLTTIGQKEASILKISKLYLKANLSNTTLYLARSGGIFSCKTLKFFYDNIPNFKENIHYIEIIDSKIIPIVEKYE